MKGIFLNHFYRMRSHMKLLLSLAVLVGGALLVTGNATLLELFTYIFIAQIAVSGIAGMHSDAASNWSKYELTLPIRRADIVKGKFLSYLAGVAFAVAVIGIFVCTTLVLHRETLHYDARQIASLVSLGVGIAIMVGAFFFLLVFWLGVDKSDSMLTISMLAAVAFIVFLVQMVHPFAWQVGLTVFNLTHLLLFLLSFLICRARYCRQKV